MTERDPQRVATGRRARSHARRLALQALYEWQINPRPWREIARDLERDGEADRVDREYFRESFGAVAEQHEELDLVIAKFGDIAPPALDPIEHAVLWLGVYELGHRPELPYRVALTEAVELAKRFGATDAHKYVNAVLDRAARELRSLEYGRERS